ncbi:MAG: hypothetical protein U9N60_02085 [Thermodesulfobacteriota bacterium]|nr:hypothetical protein [Thermodesulfobacteriota bacterium]
MRTFIRSILVLVCMLSLTGLVGCEQAEEPKNALTETVDKAQETIKDVTVAVEESEVKVEEIAEPAEEK